MSSRPVYRCVLRWRHLVNAYEVTAGCSWCDRLAPFVLAAYARAKLVVCDLLFWPACCRVGLCDWNKLVIIIIINYLAFLSGDSHWAAKSDYLNTMSVIIKSVMPRTRPETVGDKVTGDATARVWNDLPRLLLSMRRSSSISSLLRNICRIRSRLAFPFC